MPQRAPYGFGDCVGIAHHVPPSETEYFSAEFGQAILPPSVAEDGFRQPVRIRPVEFQGHLLLQIGAVEPSDDGAIRNPQRILWDRQRNVPIAQYQSSCGLQDRLGYPVSFVHPRPRLDAARTAAPSRRSTSPQPITLV